MGFWANLLSIGVDVYATNKRSADKAAYEARERKRQEIADRKHKREIDRIFSNRKKKNRV